MVYVSEMQVSLKSAKWRHSHHCYLVADTLRELHVFARLIGLRRSWFQDKRLPHYDLTASKRKLAIRKGVVKISGEELVQKIREHRKKVR